MLKPLWIMKFGGTGIGWTLEGEEGRLQETASNLNSDNLSVRVCKQASMHKHDIIICEITRTSLIESRSCCSGRSILIVTAESDGGVLQSPASPLSCYYISLSNGDVATLAKRSQRFCVCCAKHECEKYRQQEHWSSSERTCIQILTLSKHKRHNAKVLSDAGSPRKISS